MATKPYQKTARRWLGRYCQKCPLMQEVGATSPAATPHRLSRVNNPAATAASHRCNRAQGSRRALPGQHFSSTQIPACLGFRAKKNHSADAIRLPSFRARSWATLRPHLLMRLIKSKQRVADHGEVFTPARMVEARLDLVKGETERIDSRFLEPACGDGNFLVPVLRRKLAPVELKYAQSDFERHHDALLALRCIYGIELLPDNLAECRAHRLEIFAEDLNLKESADLYRAAFHERSQNLVHGDALTLRTPGNLPITFAERGCLGKGRFQRRDFRYDRLTLSSAFSAEGSLFAHLGKHGIFTPEKTYPLMTVSDLGALASGGAEPKKANA